MPVTLCGNYYNFRPGFRRTLTSAKLAELQKLAEGVSLDEFIGPAPMPRMANMARWAECNPRVWDGRVLNGRKRPASFATASIQPEELLLRVIILTRHGQLGEETRKGQGYLIILYNFGLLLCNKGGCTWQIKLCVDHEQKESQKYGVSVGSLEADERGVVLRGTLPRFIAESALTPRAYKAWNRTFPRNLLCGLRGIWDNDSIYINP